MIGTCTLAWPFPLSAKTTTHGPTPAVTSAAEGGHGYLAASVAAFPPVLSAGQVVTTSMGDPQGGPTVPDTMVNVTVLPAWGMVPWGDTWTARERARALQETGTVSCVPRMSRLTVGWPASLLHCSTMPMADGSNPDPVIVTTVPAFRHVPGETVIVAAPPVAVVGWGMHDANVVVVVDAVVEVVVDDVDVVDDDVVVVVVVGWFLALAAVAKAAIPANPVTTATDPMSPSRT